jgi:hypothetical protein
LGPGEAVAVGQEDESEVAAGNFQVEGGIGAFPEAGVPDEFLAAQLLD